MKKLLYNEYVSKIANCPNDDYCERDVEKCYHFVTDNILDDINFEPTAIKSHRANDPSHLGNCGRLATSFYTNYDKAIERFEDFKNNMNPDKIKDKIGSSIAKGKLTKNCGISNLPSIKTTHFETHLYTKDFLYKNFTIDKKLI